MIHRLVGAGTAVLALVVVESVTGADWNGQSYGAILPPPAMGYFGAGYRPSHSIPYPPVQRQYGNHAFHSNRVGPHMDPYSANGRYPILPAPVRSFGIPYSQLRSHR